MADVAKKIYPLKEGREGSATVSVQPTGNLSGRQTADLPGAGSGISVEGLENKYTDRFDDYAFYQ